MMEGLESCTKTTCGYAHAATTHMNIGKKVVQSRIVRSRDYRAFQRLGCRESSMTFRSRAVTATGGRWGGGAEAGHRTLIILAARR